MSPQWKLAEGRTWRQKLEQDHPNHGKKVPIPRAMQRRFGSGTLLIPRPLDVDACIRTIRKGRLMTQSQLRARLAVAAGADAACPMTTGIFVRIAAEAAMEAHRAGKIRITPFWRIIRDDGSLNEKFPGGAAAQATRLRREGFRIIAALGKRPPKVDDFQRFLVKT